MSATIGDVRAALVRRFRDAGLEMPELDARLLVGHALSLDHAGLTTNATRMLDAGEQAAIETLAARRLTHEPVARIVGVKEFWSLPFTITPAVLVPRPETETVIECALALIDTDGARNEPLRILDIGTGSGALICALLSELPRATGVATDFSNDALMVARTNARTLGLADRTKFVLCDIASEVRDLFDIVVSNPPYIAHQDLEKLPPDVRDFDPHLALDGGRDGLHAYRAIAADAKRLLKPGALLIVELGIGQMADVEAIFTAAGLSVEGRKDDLARVPRVLALRRNS